MNANQIQGVWKLVSTKALHTDGPYESDEHEWNMIKIITKSHFIFVEQALNRPRMQQGGTDEELLQAVKTFFGGAGTYTFDGKNYREHISIFLNPNYVNTTITYACIFSGDLWEQRGIFPMKSVGLKDDDYEMFEVWKRIE